MLSSETSKCASSTIVIIADEIDFHISDDFVVEENCNDDDDYSSSALILSFLLSLLIKVFD
jgi:hypothetical protein